MENKNEHKFWNDSFKKSFENSQALFDQGHINDKQLKDQQDYFIDFDNAERDSLKQGLTDSFKLVEQCENPEEFQAQLKKHVFQILNCDIKMHGADYPANFLKYSFEHIVSGYLSQAGSNLPK